MTPSDHIRAANAAARMSLPFTDRQDFEDATRGYITALSEPIVTATDGRVVWDITGYGDLSGEAPDSVHPSLWRSAQLNVMHGLFEVVPGVYQVRGLDISNMTLVEGEDGVIVIDPLISCETAAAALELYRSHRGDRPVTAVIYTHSHVDHFGGVRGVLPGDIDVPIVAPEGFLAHAVSENLYAGTAMTRRAIYMYGSLLPKGPLGQITTGLGATTSAGRVTLVPPTVDITTTGQELVLDGVRIVFQMTPGTEAPAEMNFHFPDLRLLCMAENATHNLHNVVTLRGAIVRDAHAWAGFLDEAIELFADSTDTLFASHHWPTWGRDNIVDYLSKQRDLYAYLHDQTLRLMNKGLTGIEIAEELDLPPTLASSWHCRGYYGSVNHNVKAIYQRYMGWFDGNPAHLWMHPPEVAAVRYVEFMGGAEAVLDKARRSFEEGDYRWVAEVVNHVVFADPGNTEARELQAQTLEQLAYGSENATWRNFYLMGALELRGGPVTNALGANALEMLSHLSVEQIFDATAIRLDGPRAGSLRLGINWTIDGAEHFLRLENAVLSQVSGRHDGSATLHIDIARSSLLFLLLGFVALDDLVASGSAGVDGDMSVFATLRSLLDSFDPAFAIVTP
ncbi:MAG: MBL fold metallo-hydrolase [Acidobacteria bacterium]|nr:MBL fold metallo-hydrolase [Acidobacteriota bacterium]